MRVYLVGGAVRDKILGRKVYERDFLVTGSTPSQMIEAGYRQVGTDFPVFLHPKTGEEYALARTERKTGKGHGGFAFNTSPEVTAAQDLMRRDFTVNAMAIDVRTGELTDPYGGRADCGKRVLRHVSGAFREDPLRVLRTARFAAQLNFDVCEKTTEMAKGMAAEGALGELSAERVWREIERGLSSIMPVRFVCELKKIGALAAVLPELEKLFGMPCADHEDDAGRRTLAVLGIAELNKWGLPVLLGCLLHKVGGSSASAAKHSNGGDIAQAICLRLRMPAKLRLAVVTAVREYRTVLGLHNQDARAILALLERTGAFRSTHNLEFLHGVCDCVYAESSGSDAYALHPNRSLVANALRAAKGTPVAAAAKGAPDPGAAVRAARLEALKAANLFSLNIV